jgi:dynein heavy chain
MLVGETFSGKSCVIKTLQLAMNILRDGNEFTKTHIKYLNPKSITHTQLYGKLNENTQEWHDGVLALIIKEFASNKSNERKWVIFDGPVDALWIEDMNTVLDDNKMLCLSSGEIIKLSEGMTLMFEVEDLIWASPATVSRCGMVFLEAAQLGWEILVIQFLNTLPHYMYKYTHVFESLLLYLLHPVMEFTRKRCKMPIYVSVNEYVFGTLSIMKNFVELFAVHID